MTQARSLALAVALAAAAPAALRADPAAEPPTAAAETLPTPYTAEQIRDVWRPGFRVEMRTREGERETRQRMTVLSATDELATIRSEALDAAGAPSGPARELSPRWTELRDHALFPAAQATRERAECRSPLGKLPGWRYVVRREGGETLTMCFADATPGPPVELEARRGEALISRMERVSSGPSRSDEGGAP